MVFSAGLCAREGPPVSMESGPVSGSSRLRRSEIDSVSGCQSLNIAYYFCCLMYQNNELPSAAWEQ